MAPQKKEKISVKRNTKAYAQQDLTKSSASSKPGSRPAAATAKNPSINRTPSAEVSSSRPALKSVGPELDVASELYDDIWRDTKSIMGNKPIHANDQNRIDHILRVFDLNSAYGPCAGMSRLERWERAEEMELSPPEEVKKILLTQQGQTELRYSHSVLQPYGL